MAAPTPKTTGSLDVYLVTFNCARNLIDAPVLSKSLFHALPESIHLPEFVAISLQEIAPIAYSFLGGSCVAPYLRQITQTVELATQQRAKRRHRTAQEYGNRAGPTEDETTAAEDDEDEESRYLLILARHVGMTALLLFVREDISDRVCSIKTAGAGCGIWDMGNKGAVGARISMVDGTELTFVAAHLAPFEWMVNRRNRDYEHIVRNLGFTADPRVHLPSEPPSSSAEQTREDDNVDETTGLLSNGNISSIPSGLYDTPGHLFFAGDLNYRTSDTPPKPEHYSTYPQPSVNVDESSLGDFFKRDQLQRELKAGNVLHGFIEHSVEFPPTYKYVTKDLPFPQEIGMEPTVWPWAIHRWPSYCDRILYLPVSAVNCVKVHGYKALPIQETSDHRPVALSLSVPSGRRKQNDARVVTVPFPLDPKFAQNRAAARRREIIVGVLAYFTVTKEGNAILAGLLAGAIAGWYLLQQAI